MTDRLKQQLDFILEIDQEKNILRQTHLSHHGRRENDAEHAWHMTIMAYLLKEYANEPIDIAKVMMMCLLHDVVEIDAGDTYAYDEAGKQTQQAREAAAKERIYSLLPDDQKQELQALFDEFEADKPQNLNSPMPWTTCSRSCSTTAIRAATGKNILSQRNRSTIGKFKRKTARKCSLI